MSDENENNVKDQPIEAVEKVKDSKILFEIEQNLCDVTIAAHDKNVLVTSKFLRYLFSGRFESLVKKQTAEEVVDEESKHMEYIVEVNEIGADVIEFALSFYQPMYFNYADTINASTKFNNLLELSNQWGLEVLKKELENFLLLKHPDGPSQISDNTQLNDKQLDILLKADKFELKNLYRTLLRKKPRMELSTISKENKTFIDMKPITRYELIRNSLIEKSKSHTSDNKFLTEIEDIFKFCDVILYEDRVIDLSAKKDFENADHFKFDGNDKNSFLAEPNNAHYAILIAEDVKLYVDSFVLSEASPVFEEMLETASRDVNGKKILELPGKCFDQVVQFLTFLKKPTMIREEKVDMLSLATLAAEYKVDRLLKRIEEFIQKIEEKRPKILLKYLKLASEMNFSKEATENILNQIGRGAAVFGEFQLMKDFSLLNFTIKKRLTKFRLWFRMYSMCSGAYKKNRCPSTHCP
ncbi:uncharacterized protein [Clytia hemisphaerica]|uniref:BTB domain-containing protein n=1 Tax=Clytia hemisphaerica TaxID=252671 RepID=A0A7M5X4Z5_9CNID